MTTAKIYLCFGTVAECDKKDKNFEQIKKDNPHITSNNLIAGTPFIRRHSSAPPSSQLQRDIRSLLALPIDQRRNLAQINQHLGNDVMLGFAEMFENQLIPAAKRFGTWSNDQKYTGVAGAGIGILLQRQTELQSLLGKYQESLEAIREAHQAKKPKAKMVILENKARKVHQELNRSFRHELDKQVKKVQSRRGTALSNVERGIHQAKDSRYAEPIQITNSSELNRVKMLSRGLQLGGKLISRYDMLTRGYKVYDDYSTGKDALRTAIVQTSGFGAGSYFGTLAARMFATRALATLALGVELTPIGWVITLAVGVGVTYFVSSEMDLFTQKSVGKIYDKVKGLL